MKLSIFFLCVFSLAVAIPVPEDVASLIIAKEKEISFDLSKEFVEEFLEVSKSRKVGAITAIINDYVDKLMANVDYKFIHSGLDPTQLPNVTEVIRAPLKVGQITLKNGWLQGLSSIRRNGDVVVTYDPDGSNKLSTVLNLAFDVLSINYDYSAKVMFIGPSGGVEAKITNLQIEIRLSFDFNCYQAALTSFRIPNSGHIDLNFSGNILTDWVLNLFINVTTTILHRIILVILDLIIKIPLEDIIKTINAILNNILNPTTTTTAATTTVKVLAQSLNNL